MVSLFRTFLLCILLVGCHHDSNETSSVPTAFNLTSIEPIKGAVKSFDFQWQESEFADSYTLCQKAVLVFNECEPILENIAASATSVTIALEKILNDDTFFILAKNSVGTAKSSELTISPDLIQSSIGFIKPQINDSLDAFGQSIAISENGLTLAVGALNESSSGTGLTADPKDNSAKSSGAVYIFQYLNGNWAQNTFLKASNTGAGDQFGHSVAISGNGQILAVGALQESSNTRGINGNEADNSNPLSGVVYVFQRQGSTWRQNAYLKASNSDALDAFGFSLSLNFDGTLLLVGAPGEAGKSSGIDGDASDNSARYSGASYLFERNGESWTQLHYIKASNPDINDSFGYDVSISHDGTKFAIGAPGEASASMGINNDQSDNSKVDSGAVYVFSHTAGVPKQEFYVKASNTDQNDQFGFSVTLNNDGSVMGVGAYKEAADTTVNGDQLNNSALDAGAVYVFSEDNGFKQEAYLKASNVNSSDRFGYDIKLDASGELLAVGSPHESSSTSGVQGDELLNDAPLSGAVYLFKKEANEWQQENYIKATNTDAGDNFGQSLALSGAGESLAVGATKESSDVTLNSSQTNAPLDNTLPSSGAVYSY
ncbi:FG-GAP repeat protein [Vibrio mediterranei]|nr:FG-GAP repeat protein [Vibrio mediterranei]